jgi:hypothetical protein
MSTAKTKKSDSSLAKPDQTELKILTQKISELILKNPDKASLILTEWISEATEKKSTNKAPKKAG